MATKFVIWKAYTAPTLDNEAAPKKYIDDTLSSGNFVINWAWIKQSENTVWATEIVLSDTPMSWEAGLMVFKQDSGIHRTEPDYTYDAVNNKITFTALVAGEFVEIRYMKVNSWTAWIVPSKVNDESWAATGVTHTVTDAGVTTDTVILGRTVTAGTQVGFWEFTMANGSFTITSSASEVAGLTFNYVIL